MKKKRQKLDKSAFKNYKNFLSGQLKTFVSTNTPYQFNTRETEMGLIISKPDNPKSLIDEIKNPEFRPYIDDLKRLFRQELE
jgi:hypothetical protein